MQADAFRSPPVRRTPQRSTATTLAEVQTFLGQISKHHEFQADASDTPPAQSPIFGTEPNDHNRRRSETVGSRMSAIPPLTPWTALAYSRQIFTDCFPTP